MSRRSFCTTLAILGLAALSAGAQQIRIAVMDFDLQSDDPRFKYLGKGFAELTAVEIAHMPGVVLVDRDRRNAILKEQEFSLSGAADESSAMEIGKLLSVNYIVSGTIIDMLGDLVVSYEVVTTDTGAVVGKETTEGAPAEYKRMVRDIGRGIGVMTGRIAAAAGTVAPPPAVSAPGKQTAVLSDFSEAVAALDTKDVATAKARLEAAQALDPTDPAVRYYLDKLASGTSKFAVIPEPYYLLDNPATLAFRDKDMAYAYGAVGGTYLTGGPWPNGEPPDKEPGTVPLHNLYGADDGGLGPFGDREIEGDEFVGYTMPIGKDFGLGAEAFFSHREYDLVRMNGPMSSSPPLPAPYVPAADSKDFSGGVVSFGWAVTRRVALGASATLGTYSGWVGDWRNGGMSNSIVPGSFAAGEIGLLLRNSDGSLVYAFSAGASNYQTDTFNSDTVEVNAGNSAQFSTYWDASVAWSYDRLTDFLVLKAMADLSGLQLASSSSYFQVLPAFEHWFGHTLSLRLGADVTFVADQAFETGLGGTAGLTLVLGAWEIDFGGTYRMQPSEVVGGELIPVTVFSIGIRRNGIFVYDR
ncbi:MAG: CsgG/HfaB family protein [Rectinemataceae bacterium]